MQETVVSLSDFIIAVFGPSVLPQRKGSTHELTFDIRLASPSNDLGDDRLWIAEDLCRLEVLNPGPVGRAARNQALMSTYMYYHCIEILQDSITLTARTITDANKDLLMRSRELYDAATTLKFMHLFAPPGNGTNLVAEDARKAS